MTDRFRQARLYTNHQSHSDDLISERVSQLKALLATLTGEGFDSFKQHNDDIQSKVIWLCSSMISDIHWHLDHPDEHLKEVKS